MLAAFTSKSVSAEKQLLFPNGVRLAALPERGFFRKRYGFGGDDFLAVYSGNLGVKQGLEVLVHAAAALCDARVRIVICGDGAQRETLAAQIGDARNIRLLPLLPDAEYREMLADADVALITQQPASGRAFFPSKLLNALAAARPIVAVADDDSELSRVVREAACGTCVAPQRPEELAKLLDSLAKDPAPLANWAQAGRTWVAQFEQERVLEKFASAVMPRNEEG
jgi:colanic acid biosynthesis glycosyl transferase WcaI